MTPSKPQRVLIFSLVYYPRFVGGAEVAVKEITDRIGREDIEFEMITMRTERAPIEKMGNVLVRRVGIPWYGNPRSPLFYAIKYFYMPWAYICAQRLQRKNKYDAVWCIMASYAAAPSLAFKWFNKKTDLVLTLQEGDSFDHIRRRTHITYPFWKGFFKRADRIQAISKYLAEWGRDMGAACPIEVVPNGVDYDHFASPISVARRADIRTECGFSDSDIVLVTAGRLVRKNAVDDIVSSLSHLPLQYKFLSIGSGEDLEALKALAARSGVESRVVFKPFMTHEHLPEYLQACDIFVRPSRSEGLGNSFLEAMAAGIPVIATPVGGIPDFLSDGETGLFAEVDNPKSIALRAEKLAKDRESRDYIVKNARQMVAEKYRWESIAARMKALLLSR